MSLFAGWLLLLTGLFAVGALLIWVLQPLRDGGSLPAADDARLLALLMEREGMLASLRDLDADLAAGRISAALQQPLRENVLAQGSRVLAAIDDNLARLAGDRREGLERLEAAVAGRRGKTVAASAGITSDLSALSGGRDPMPRGNPTSLVTCPDCGRVTASEDRFCRHCGRDLSKGKLV